MEKDKMKNGKIIFPRASRLMRGIDEAGFKRLCDCLRVRELHVLNKQTFIREDDPCDVIGLVALGSVQLSRTRIDGGRNVLETVPAGDVFGVTYAFRDASTMGINATSIGESVVLLFSTECITRPCGNVCAEHLQFVRNLLAITSQKTFQMKQKLRILSRRTIRERLMLALQICAKRAKSNEFDLSLDRQALADYLCVDRCALSAELSRLQREGVLTFEKSHFVLH